jgi:hypothetical protein
MLVKLIVNPGSNEYPSLFTSDIPVEGSEVEVSNDLGAKLIRRKHGIDVTPPRAPAIAEEVSEVEADASAADGFAETRKQNKSKASK